MRHLVLFGGTGEELAVGSLSLVKFSVVSRLGRFVVSLTVAERGMWMSIRGQHHRRCRDMYGVSVVAMGLQG